MKTMHMKLWCLAGMLFCLNLMAAEPNADQMFFNDVYSGSTFEIQAGTIAGKKSANADVGKFAKMMVEDHGKAKKELDELASKKKWTLPTNPPEQHQKTLDRFAGEEGAAFESDYVKTMKEDHQADAAKIKNAIPGITDSDLKNWTSKYLDVVNKHAKEAESLGTK